MKISTSFKTPDYGNAPCCASEKPSKKTPMKTVYPEVTLRDCPGLAKAVQAGESFKATVEFVPTAINITEGSSQPWQQDGCNVTMEIHSIDMPEMDKESEKMETVGDALRKFMEKKKK